jgi:O-methyltransferase
MDYSRRMTYRYSALKRFGIRAYRQFVPSIDSPYTLGQVDDVCAVRTVSSDKMQNFFTDCVRTLQIIRGNDIGDYLEFGVFNGTSLSNMYFTTRKLGLTSMRLFGFDAFEGLPPESEYEDAGVWKRGFYTCSLSQLEQCLRRRNVDTHKIHIVKGWYKDTLNQDTIRKFGFDNPGIIFIDCDTYSSSKSALNFVAPLIQDAVIICLDDWRLYDLDLKGLGEYKSFNEFLEMNTHLKAKEIGSYKRNARCFIVVRKK